MSLEFNEKGKYYTDIISKTAIPVIIQTTLHRIDGFVHVRLDGRLKDELDSSDPFLAVTSAKILDAGGSVLQEADFISVSRAQIVWVALKEETAKPGEEK